MDRVDVLIVGAGLTGCTLAERFAKVLHRKVLIIDKRNHIGGNCYDFVNELGIRESKYGAHLFHTNNEVVWNYISAFTTWRKYEHQVKAFVKDKIVPIPVNIDTVNKIFGLNIKNEQEMEEWLIQHQIKYDREPMNSEEVGKARVGVDLYNLLFREYTKKQWDKYPEELDPSVLERIPVRNNFENRYFMDKFQYLPEFGYHALFENMLDSPNISVHLNCDYFEMKDVLPKHEFLIFTGPIDQYFADSNLEKLEYRSIRFERKNILDIDYFQENSVINYPGPEVPFTRIVEYKHFNRPQEVPRLGTTIVYETTTFDGDPYYPVPNQKNIDLYKKYKKLAEEEELKNNVYFIGRLANYKYFNMDQAIENALAFFDQILAKYF